VDGGKQEDGEIPLRFELVEGLGGSFPLAAAVLALEVVPVLPGGDLEPEVEGPGEVLDVEELGFDAAVEALDFGLGVGTSGHDSVGGSEVLLDGVGEA